MSKKACFQHLLKSDAQHVGWLQICRIFVRASLLVCERGLLFFFGPHQACTHEEWGGWTFGYDCPLGFRLAFSSLLVVTLSIADQHPEPGLAQILLCMLLQMPDRALQAWRVLCLAFQVLLQMQGAVGSESAGVRLHRQQPPDASPRLLFNSTGLSPFCTPSNDRRKIGFLPPESDNDNSGWAVGLSGRLLAPGRGCAAYHPDLPHPKSCSAQLIGPPDFLINPGRYLRCLAALALG